VSILYQFEPSKLFLCSVSSWIYFNIIFPTAFISHTCYCTKIIRNFLAFPIRVACPVHPIPLDLITKILLGGKRMLRNLLQPHITSSVLERKAVKEVCSYKTEIEYERNRDNYRLRNSMIRVFILKGYNGTDRLRWERQLNIWFGWRHILKSCKSRHKEK
jgi:hypothetical protein